MKHLYIRGIRFYQRYISSNTMPSCRFLPTCSQYAVEALQKHTLMTASWLIIKRIVKCHPWGSCGIDEVP